MVSARPVVAAIGNFDGVHRGHQHLLQETARFARALNAQVGVVLFEPHPRRYFNPDEPPFLITTPAYRDELLKAHGVQTIMTLTFDQALASLTPEDFVNDVLKDKLGLAGVMAGADFRFGKGREGDGAALASLAEKAGLQARLVELLSQSTEAEKFGSSAARAALREGNMRQAALMLGRPWAVRGCVLQGQKLGRALGFPTANLTLGDVIEPRKGVYATRAIVGGGTYNAVSNFGRRPTVGADAPLLETHLFDFDGDLYGKEIEVAFVDFIREEQKFDGLDALKAQIGRDCAVAREILATSDG